MSRRDEVFAARVEAEVRRRVAAIDAAKAIAPNEDYSGMTEEEIRARAVAAVKGPQALVGREPDAIEAVFDHLCEQRSDDPVRRTLASRLN